MSTEVKHQIRESYARLGQVFSTFKPRREQNYLVAEIAQTLLLENDEKRLLVCEAGTGIGKSLAYLQAAVPCAKHAKKTLVISTATVALQEQLIASDLPLYQKIASESFTYTLVKGRQRYCCQHRLEQAASGDTQSLEFEDLSADKLYKKDVALLQKLWKEYQDGHWSGDRDLWPDPIPEVVWQLIIANRHSCQRHLSHHYHCPFQRARRDLETMDILIVNHALLVSDLHMGGGVILPEPQDCFYVIDEAHHFPYIARDQGASQASLRAWIKSIEHLLPLIRGAYTLVAEQASSTEQQALTTDLQCIQTSLKTILQWAVEQPQLQQDEQISRFPNQDVPAFLLEQTRGLQNATLKVIKRFDKLLTHLSDAVKEGLIKQKEANVILPKLGFYHQRLETLNQLCSLYNQDNKKDQAPIARWFESSERDIALHASPVEVGSWLGEHLWEQAGAVVLVSATLTALNSFDYFKTQSGLVDYKDTKYLRLSSPFDYQKSLLHIPSMPCDPSSQDFTDALIEALQKIITSNEAYLVLFSSYQQMHQVYEKLSTTLESPIFMQGQKTRSTLLSEYKQRCDRKKTSILFGTASFMEGLDLPGHYLTRLIITKLPFAVPTSPVEESTAEWIEQQGQNPFLQMTVPETSRKLIQACGRLIRKESDKGEVYLLDRRIVTRRYGKSLLKALPPFTQKVASQDR